LHDLSRESVAKDVPDTKALHNFANKLLGSSFQQQFAALFHDLGWPGTPVPGFKSQISNLAIDDRILDYFNMLWPVVCRT
jgi:hypothetical protein